MKLWVLILVSAVIAVGAVVVNDRLRDEGDTAAGEVATDPVDLSGIDRRLAALEADETPMLEGRAEELPVEKRLDEFDRRLRRLEAAWPGSEGTTADSPVPPTSKVADGEIDPEDVERFRKLRGAAIRAEKRSYQVKRVAKVLKALDLALSKKQQERLVDEIEAFSSFRDVLWREAKSQALELGGEVDWKRVVEETNAAVRRAFSDRISAFIPRQDSDQIAESLYGVGSK